MASGRSRGIPLPRTRDLVPLPGLSQLYVDPVTNAVMVLHPDGTRTSLSGAGGGSVSLASTVETETGFGQVSAVGTSSSVARADHTHGTPSIPTPGDIGAQPASAELDGLAGVGDLGVIIRTLAGELIAAWPALIYGSALDGDVHFDGSSTVTINGASHAPSGGTYTLVQDVDADTITVSGGAVVVTNGYRIRCWRLESSGSGGTFRCNGVNASGSGGGNGWSLDGTLYVSSGNGANGRTGTGAGTAASAQTSSWGGSGGTGGASGGGQAGGAGGTASKPNSLSGRIGAGWTVLTGQRIAQNTIQGINGGGGGGGGGCAGTGTSGAGGAGGGTIYIAAAVVDAAGLTVEAKGGNGSNAVTGGGGGGGGGGGLIYLVTSKVTAAFSTSVAGGTGGNGAGTGLAGSTGSSGNSVVIYT